MKAGKAGEVGVRALELEPMLDRESREMGVGGQVAARAEPAEQPEKNFSVPFAGMD